MTGIDVATFAKQEERKREDELKQRREAKKRKQHHPGQQQGKVSEAFPNIETPVEVIQPPRIQRTSVYEAAAIADQHAPDQTMPALQQPGLQPTAPREFMVHRAAEALQPQPPISWVVKDLFAEATVSLIVGKPGSKKTWVLLDLAVAVAQGETWLNYQTISAPVLFIDEESGNKSILRRLGATMRGHNAGPDTRFSYITLQRIDLRKPEDVIAITALIIQEGAKLVIIDALADIMPGSDENAVKDVQPIFMALRKIAETTDACLLLVHHASKAGGYRGSSSMDGAIDNMVMFESAYSEKIVTIKTEKVRDIEPQTFYALANFENFPGTKDIYKFNLSPATKGSGSQGPRLPDVQNFILSYLADNPNSPMAAIKTAAEENGYNAEVARSNVYKLEKVGYTSRTDNGSQGTAGKYSATEKGKEWLTQAE